MTDIVELLCKRYAAYEGAEPAFGKAADEIKRLREELQWYADKANYATGQDCPDVLIDGGALARRALGLE